MDNWGLVGQNISYSLSPLIHNYLIKKYNINAKYCLYDLKQYDLHNLQCGNITIPFKYEVHNNTGKLSNFNSQSINTFKKVNDEYEFYSTDQYGIINTIEKLKISFLETRIHIIYGSGATAKMIEEVLCAHFNVDRSKIYIVSRNKFNIKQNPRIVNNAFIEDKITKNYIVYNTTPLGNGNNADKMPCSENVIKNAVAVFDTAYNPPFNMLGKQCFKQRVKYTNGLNMLIVQALHSFQLWTGINVQDDYLEVKKRIHLQTNNKLIICAMPFAGKTTLFKRNRKNACDLDSEIEKYTKMKNNNFINKYGIDKFRNVEQEVLRLMLISDQIKIIFLGGGTLTNNKAIDHLNNELVVYMTVSLNQLKERFDKSRANIKSVSDLEKLFSERDTHYKNIAQMQVGCKQIKEFLHEYLDN